VTFHSVFCLKSLFSHVGTARCLFMYDLSYNFQPSFVTWRGLPCITASANQHPYHSDALQGLVWAI
jgi:hypothetical protein